MSVLVIGSINMDLLVRTPRLPTPGETILGSDFLIVPGGKGANQAVACARLSATTYMVGKVGNDDFGRTLRAGMIADGVNVSNVALDDSLPTGIALITVEATGENTIIVVPGANAAISLEDLTDLPEDLMAQASVMLLQLEIPLETVLAAARLGRKHGLNVILDPAPARELPQELYELVDVLTPNAGEAEALVGFSLREQSDIERAAEVMIAKGARNVIITLGEEGAYWQGTTESEFFPPSRRPR